MTTTSTRVSFGLYDLEFKSAATLSATTLQPFAKLADLTNGSASMRPYASYEPDFWLLDGQYKFLPDDDTTVHVGLMSLEMSRADGSFANVPWLTVKFDEPHDTDSLSIRFSPQTGDYASTVTVVYKLGDTLLRSDVYHPTGPEFTTHQACAGFDTILLAFNETSRPYRYMRVTALDYGELISFEGSAVRSASLIEEIDPLSGELPYGALELTLYSEDAAFNLINPAGNYANLSERQPLDVYETVDGATLYIGRYYLDEWENTSDREIRFRAVDLIGVLDRVTCRGGLWVAKPLEELLEELLAPIAVPYELDSRLAGTLVTGWLPVSSYRAALQQIGFAVGAVVSCARSSVLRVYKSPLASDTATAAITRAQKGMDQSLSLKPLVTGVEVAAHNYVPGGEAQVIVSGEYAAGVHEILFETPMHALSVSGATILSSGANHALIAVTVPGPVTLSGLKYIDTVTVTTVQATGLSSTVRPNVLKVEDATLVTPANAAAVAARVYAYQQQRLRQRVKLFAPSIEPGDVVTVETLYGKTLRAVVERMESNLAGGFTAQVEMTGAEDVG